MCAIVEHFDVSFSEAFKPLFVKTQLLCVFLQQKKSLGCFRPLRIGKIAVARINNTFIKYCEIKNVFLVPSTAIINLLSL